MCGSWERPVEENRNSERWEEEDEDTSDGEKSSKNNIGRTIDSRRRSLE